MYHIMLLISLFIYEEFETLSSLSMFFSKYNLLKINHFFPVFIIIIIHLILINETMFHRTLFWKRNYWTHSHRWGCENLLHVITVQLFRPNSLCPHIPTFSSSSTHQPGHLIFVQSEVISSPVVACRRYRSLLITTLGTNEKRKRRILRKCSIHQLFLPLCHHW